MLRQKEPGRQPLARDYEKEPVSAVYRGAPDDGPPTPERWKARYLARPGEQGGLVRPREQVPPVRIGQDAFARKDRFEPLREPLQSLPPAALVGGARLFQLEGHQPR